MAVSVAAWNVREGLAQPNDMPPIVEHIRRLDADVVVLSDAFSLKNNLHASQPEVLEDAYDVLSTEGYSLLETEYDDTEAWRHDRNIMILSRLAFVQSGVVRLASRNALEVRVCEKITDTPVHIIGAHFDDRSEVTRLGQVSALRSHIDMSKPTVLAGDLNTFRSQGVGARALRSSVARSIARSIPHQRTKSVATRLSDMAQGKTLQALEAVDFRDADPQRRPTWYQMQLDHIMVSRGISVEDFFVTKAIESSDHRAIKAVLSV